ncbi:hypothetical protein E2562_039496 [Oryza meyeriana var. granulata]|uniref:Uncharacterized protein n=1 Tax=Oryza meyeriana var. granulata TaxID=110450 RepID=A0A6G1ECS9_9ORYZ|nr:hypothetical protein E2562_039496 [Oryza meyeriana var. granulata]
MVGLIMLFDKAFNHPNGTCIDVATVLSNVGPAHKEMLWPLGIRQIALIDARAIEEKAMPPLIIPSHPFAGVRINNPLEPLSADEVIDITSSPEKD